MVQTASGEIFAGLFHGSVLIFDFKLYSIVSIWLYICYIYYV